MKLFNNAKYDVLSLENFVPFSDLADSSFPCKDSEHGKLLISHADEAFKEETIEFKDAPIQERWNATELYRICIKTDKDGELKFKLVIQ